MYKRKTVARPPQRYSKRLRPNPVTHPKRVLAHKKMYKRVSYDAHKALVRTFPLRNFGQSFMPHMYQNRMVYRSMPITTGALGATGVYHLVFKGNDVYDPYGGAGGYGCVGFTQLQAIYLRYKVLSSRITVIARDYNGTVSIKHACIYPSRDSTAVTDKVRAYTTPDMSIVPIPNDGTEHKCTHFAQTNTMFCMKQCDDYTLASSVSTSPASVWYWIVMFLGETDDQLAYSVIIEYDTIWWDLKQITPPAF